jgi:hypothetical protein
MIGWFKYHAVTFVMRVCEAIATRVCSQERMNDLTYDTFRVAKEREFHQHQVQQQATRFSSHRSMKATSDITAMQNIHEMFHICWKAQLIGYFSDYLVHQALLVVAYHVYIRDYRQRHHATELARNDETKGVENTQSLENDNKNDVNQTNDGQTNDADVGPLILRFFTKSTKLALSRAIALTGASLGGAIGTYFLPGYGTIAGINIGDGVAASLIEASSSAP